MSDSRDLTTYLINQHPTPLHPYPYPHPHPHPHPHSHSHPQDHDTCMQTFVKFCIAGMYTTPFALTYAGMYKTYSVPALVLGAIGNCCIFRIGLVLYARHFMELLDPDHSLKHIAEHLKNPEEDIEIFQWPRSRKLAVTTLTCGATFASGLTKTGLNTRSNPLKQPVSLILLFLLSFIDAAPHVNHLQLQSAALKKLQSLSWLKTFWVATLAIGHALTDSADLFNAKGFWFAWIIASMITEIYLSNVEAIAHHELHFPKLTLTSAVKFLALLVGATSIAYFNWYNTFEKPVMIPENLKESVFVFLQAINMIFVTFEAWHHEDEAHTHRDPDHASNGHANCCGNGIEEGAADRFLPASGTHENCCNHTIGKGNIAADSNGNYEPVPATDEEDASGADNDIEMDPQNHGDPRGAHLLLSGEEYKSHEGCIHVTTGGEPTAYDSSLVVADGRNQNHPADSGANSQYSISNIPGAWAWQSRHSKCACHSHSLQ